jgi:macrodomain Ter protein organizer (MatP/YcbG family)
MQKIGRIGVKKTIYLNNNIYAQLSKLGVKYHISLSRVVNVLLSDTYKRLKPNEIKKVIKSATWY